MALGRGRARRPMLQRRRLTRTTHLPEIERRTGRWRVGPQCLNERRRCITPRRVPPLELPPHMGSATTAPARSTNYVVNHMCEHICEPIHSTGRILPGEPSITMCGENTAYVQTRCCIEILANVFALLVCSDRRAGADNRVPGWVYLFSFYMSNFQRSKMSRTPGSHTVSI